MLSRLLFALRRLDPFVLFGSLFLFALGISAIYSVELSRESAEFILVRKQIIAFAISLGAMVFMAVSNHLQLRNYSRVMYLLGVVLLIVVLIFGTNIRGTTGWFYFGGFSFQPVEFMKLALVVQLARFFSQKARRYIGVREILYSGFLTAIPVGLAMLQPDLGSAILLVGIWFVMLIFAGLRPLQALALGIGGVLTTLIGWLGVLKDYQKERLLVFLNPSDDPLSSGYNIAQAKIAIGSGKVFGRGLGFGSQSQLQFLPESQTDFVFAVIAEELGFVGVLLLLGLFIVLYWRILFIAWHSRGHFTQFLAIGIFAAFFVQMFVNIGVNLSLLPTTGVALPFVSYGGSSLLISFIMIGIMQSMAIKMRPGDTRSQIWYN